MVNLSRRQLAAYGADQLLSNTSPRKVAKQLAAVLVSSRRPNQAELLANDIAWELEVRGKVSNANITSAKALGDSLLKQISDHIKKSVSVEQVIINQQIDSSVIGGLRIDTAARSWDKTIKRKLTDIREVF